MALRFRSLFKVFRPPKPPTKSSQVFENGVTSEKLPSLFEIHVMVFEKLVISVFFVLFLNIFEVMFSYCMFPFKKTS